MKTYSLPVSNGLLERKHREQIGSAIWVFLWFLDRTTDESDEVGRVLRGEPLPLTRIASELGEPFSTVRKHVARLERYEYIKRLDHGNGKAVGYLVMKSKKFANRTPSKNGLGLDIPRPKMDGESAQKWTGTPSKNGHHNIDTLHDITKTEEVLSDSPVIRLPLKSGIEYPVTQADLAEYQRLYLKVDVRQELLAMRGWLLANPIKGKTRSGMPRFINGWLQRKQEKIGAVSNGNSKSDATRTTMQETLERRAARRMVSSETGNSSQRVSECETSDS